MLLNARPRDLIWTSGATASNNLAIKGAAHFRAHRGKHSITMTTEHKAVLEAFDALEKSGFEVSRLSPQSDGILALATVTMTNAMAYAFRRVTDPQLRLRIMLQNASFNALFLSRMKRDVVSDKKATEIQPTDSTGPKEDQVQSILTNISRDNDTAAGQVLGLLKDDSSTATRLINATRQMIFLKGSNSHDYKYSSAVLVSIVKRMRTRLMIERSVTGKARGGSQTSRADSYRSRVA